MQRKLLLIFLTIFLIVNCKKENNNKPTIVTTIYPLYSITKELADNDFNVINLIPPGTSPHIYEPTPSDMSNLNKANLVIFVGYNLETWLYEVIQETKSKKLEITKNLHTEGNNPHLWLDPVEVIEITNLIKENLIKIKPAVSSKIEGRADKLIDSLKLLDSEIKNEVQKLKMKSFISYHPAFYYFAKRYGLTEYTVTKSPNKNLKPSDMKRISSIIKEKNVKVIFTEEQNPSDIPYTIAKDYKLKVYNLDPIGKPGETYIELMRRNLRTITEALNE